MRVPLVDFSTFEFIRLPGAYFAFMHGIFIPIYFQIKLKAGCERHASANIATKSFR